MTLRSVARRVLKGSAAVEDHNTPTYERGRLTYGAPRILYHEGDVSSVSVGSYSSIANDVLFMPGGNHRLDWVSTFPFRAVLGLPGAYEDGHPTSRGEIVIGNDVWIGHGATILSGVTIGDGAVIGAGAVVAKSIRPYAIAVGNPAREVRRRFSDEQVDALLRVAWWDWPESLVRERVAELNGETVAGFIARFDPREDL